MTEEELFGGCKALEIQHIFGEGILQKTIWPSNWSGGQIIDAIKQAWHNKIFTYKDIVKGSESLIIHGVSHCGIEIEIILKPISENKFKLKNAYPYFNKFSKYPRQ